MSWEKNVDFEYEKYCCDDEDIWKELYEQDEKAGLEEYCFPKQRVSRYYVNRKYKQKSLARIGNSVLRPENYYDVSNYFNTIKVDGNGKKYAQPFSLSRKRRLCKKQTNKRVRKSDCPDFGAYKKKFNYRCELF
ncbi:MAG: hypothetical protein RR365_10805 [Bacteroides sp.]